MPQRSSLPSDSSATSSATSSLHPVLQAALDSLDVELEEELTRYRRQRYWQAKYGEQIPVWRPSRNTESRSPQLPLMGNPARLESVMPVQAPVETPAQPNLEPELAAVSHSVPFPSSPDSTALNDPTLPFLVNHAAMRPPDRTLDRLRELAIAAAAQDKQAETEVSSQAEFFDEEPDVEPPDLRWRSDFSESPEDYLDSTEELLQSIVEEAQPSPVERESSLLNSLLTPLGVGSMVLLLLSSATLGYVIMHPSSLDLLNPTENRSASQGAGDSASSKPFASPLIPDSPNLAAEEFVDLNVDNLSTIPGATAPAAGTAAPGRAASGQVSGQTNGQDRSLLPAPSQITSTPAPNLGNEQSDNSAAPIAVDPPPAVESTSAAAVDSAPAPLPDPEPAVSQPQPETPAPDSNESLPAIDPPAPTATSIPETAAPEVAAAPTSPAAGTYYVVTPYNGDPSLEQARGAVPGAYVRNFETGANVQLGVFSSAENAQALVQELEAKGIAAEVYQP